MKGYFGSVRFFKNLILLVIIVAIAVPTVIAFNNGSQVKQAVGHAAELDALLLEMQKKDAMVQSREVIEEAQSEMEEEEPEEQQKLEQSPSEINYQTLYPDFYAPQPLQADTISEKTIYLTFDDGPSERTDEVLAILAEKNVKATFFVVGKEDEASLARMKAIVDAGHTIGMHSYSHKYAQIYESVENYLDDMYQLFVLIKEETGVTPTVFRLPGGSINAYNSAVYQEIIAEMLRRGFVPYDWNLSSEDAASNGPTSIQIISNVTSRAAKVSRGIVLMHDSVTHTATVGALAETVDQLKEMGYSFAALTPEVRPMLFSYTS